MIIFIQTFPTSTLVCHNKMLSTGILASVKFKITKSRNHQNLNSTTSQRGHLRYRFSAICILRDRWYPLPKILSYVENLYKWVTPKRLSSHLSCNRQELLSTSESASLKPQNCAMFEVSLQHHTCSRESQRFQPCTGPSRRRGLSSPQAPRRLSGAQQ